MDRLKVLEGFRTIIQEMQAEVEEWKDYSDSELATGITVDCDWWLDAVKKCNDALELLKAQEPIEPIEREGFYYCGKCKYAFTVHRQKYCSQCGQAVAWE